MTAAGVWTYTLDDDDPDVQALNGTATLTDTFTVRPWTAHRKWSPSLFTRRTMLATCRRSGNTFAVGELGMPSVNGTVVGFVTVARPDDNAGFTFSLLNDAGGRFSIHSTNGLIKVANRRCSTSSRTRSMPSPCR